MKIETERKGEAVVMKLSGRFTAALRPEFIQAIAAVTAAGEGERIEVQLAEVSYIDSAGLGMLVILRSKAQESGKPLKLVGPSGDVKDAFDITHFDEIFEIEW